MHALFYSGFLEDPLTWFVLAVAAGWLMRPATQRAADAPAERRRVRAAGGRAERARRRADRALGLVAVLLGAGDA